MLPVLINDYRRKLRKFEHRNAAVIIGMRAVEENRQVSWAPSRLRCDMVFLSATATASCAFAAPVSDLPSAWFAWPRHLKRRCTMVTAGPGAKVRYSSRIR